MLYKKISPRHLSTLAVILLLLLIPLTSCMKSAKATDITLAYYSLITQQDTTPLITLGMSEAAAQQTLTSLQEDLHSQIKNQLHMNGRLNLDDTTINQVTTAYLSSFNQLSSTATSRKEKERYIVTLSTTYIDYYRIDEIATNNSLKTIDINKYKDHKIYLNDLTRTYIKELLSGYAKAQASSDTVSKEFIFTKQNGLYLPEDYPTFTKSLCELICMQHS